MMDVFIIVLNLAAGVFNVCMHRGRWVGFAMLAVNLAAVAASCKSLQKSWIWFEGLHDLVFVGFGTKSTRRITLIEGCDPSNGKPLLIASSSPQSPCIIATNGKRVWEAFPVDADGLEEFYTKGVRPKRYKLNRALPIVPQKLKNEFVRLEIENGGI